MVMVNAVHTIILGVALTACASTTYQTDVDAVLASHRAYVQLPPPEVSPYPQAGEVGQWVLYRSSRNGAAGYLRIGLTQDRCGVWLEQDWVTRDHRSVSKVCYSAMPDLAAPSASWAPLVRVAVSQNDRDEPVVVDLRDHDNEPMRRSLKLDQFHAGLDSARWRHDDLPREDLDVAAGHFAQAILVKNTDQRLTMWFHTGVPITSMLKSRASDGTELELVAFGDHGAVASLPGVPDDSTAYKECTMQAFPAGSLHTEPMCRSKQHTVSGRAAWVAFHGI
jgi:hypothetical protein